MIIYNKNNKKMSVSSMRNTENTNKNDIYSQVTLNKKEERIKQIAKIEDKEENSKQQISNESNDESQKIPNIMINNLKLYQYPICECKEKDLFKEYQLRIIKYKKDTEDIFLKNYLKQKIPKSNKSVADIKPQNMKSSFFITAEEGKNVFNQNPNNLNRNNIQSNYVNNNNQTDDQTSYFSHRGSKMHKSKSQQFLNPYSKKAIQSYKNIHLIEMEKRGNLYNKRMLAPIQRQALYNFSHFDINNKKIKKVNSIPYKDSNESYILETKKRKKLPGLKEYICGKLKYIRKNEIISPEMYRNKDKDLKFQELIDIKNNDRFKFHVFHDQYGYVKEMDKQEKRELKMTKNKIRDLKIMAKINKINDQNIIDSFKKATSF